MYLIRISQPNRIQITVLNHLNFPKKDTRNNNLEDLMVLVASVTAIFNSTYNRLLRGASYFIA